MFRSLLSLLALVMMTSCAGYRLGPTNGETAGARSVQVEFFQNKTLEPRLQAPLNTALRRAIQKDGTYRLDTKGEGDLVLRGTITEYNRSGVSFQPTDVITVRDYGLSVAAQVSLVERSTGKVLWEKQVTGRTTIRVGADLGSAERQAAPLLAQDLARNATSLLVDGTW